MTSNKFIPIVRESTGNSPVPIFLSSKLYVNFRDDADFKASFDELLREIHNVPLSPEPPIGENPFTKPSGTAAASPPSTSNAIDLSKLHTELTQLLGKEFHPGV